METMIHLCDHVIPEKPVRQFVVTLPIAIRYIIANSRRLQVALHREVIKAIDAYYQGIANEHGIKNPLPGSITFTQRFSSDLSLNIHYHIIYVDGIYYQNSKGEVKFRRIHRLGGRQTEEILSNIVTRVVKLLQKKGILDIDFETVYLPEDKLLEISPNLAKAMHASTRRYVGLGERAGMPVRKIGKGMGYVEQESKRRGRLCFEKNGFTIPCSYHRKGHRPGRSRKASPVYLSASSCSRPPILQRQWRSYI